MAMAADCIAGNEHGWEEHWDEGTQQPYFYNRNTTETTWDRPEGFTGNPEGFDEQFIAQQQEEAVQAQPYEMVENADNERGLVNDMSHVMAEGDEYADAVAQGQVMEAHLQTLSANTTSQAAETESSGEREPKTVRLSHIPFFRGCDLTDPWCVFKSVRSGEFDLEVWSPQVGVLRVVRHSPIAGGTRFTRMVSGSGIQKITITRSGRENPPLHPVVGQGETASTGEDSNAVGESGVSSKQKKRRRSPNQEEEDEDGDEEEFDEGEDTDDSDMGDQGNEVSDIDAESSCWAGRAPGLSVQPPLKLHVPRGLASLTSPQSITAGPKPHSSRGYGSGVQDGMPPRQQHQQVMRQTPKRRQAQLDDMEEEEDEELIEDWDEDDDDDEMDDVEEDEEDIAFTTGPEVVKQKPPRPRAAAKPRMQSTKKRKVVGDGKAEAPVDQVMVKLPNGSMMKVPKEFAERMSKGEAPVQQQHGKADRNNSSARKVQLGNPKSIPKAAKPGTSKASGLSVRQRLAKRMDKMRK